jgi:Dioxygenases related to 2-nitropropane dioxygenase
MTSVGTMALVPEVVDVTQNAVVVASGGIADGRGYAAARMLGADGIEMGTAFLATVEGGVHENVKNAVLNAKEEDLVMTGYSTGAPCWQISNHLSDRLNQLEQDNAPTKIAPKIAELSSGSLRIASQEGDVDEAGAVMPGQIVTLITETKSVSQILADVYNDGVQVLKSAATFLELQ